MFDGLFYSFRLWRLQKRRQQVERENDRKVRNVRLTEKDSELIRAAEYEAWMEDLEFNGEILQLQTRHLIWLANKYVLPFPEQSDWMEEAPYYVRHLSREAIARLRSAIRLEQKERWERVARWVPILTAITGLLGVLIGVIAAAKH